MQINQADAFSLAVTSFANLITYIVVLPLLGSFASSGV